LDVTFLRASFPWAACGQSWDYPVENDELLHQLRRFIKEENQVSHHLTVCVCVLCAYSKIITPDRLRPLSLKIFAFAFVVFCVATQALAVAQEIGGACFIPCSARTLENVTELLHEVINVAVKFNSHSLALKPESSSCLLS
jgi:hypothetical protein